MKVAALSSFIVQRWSFEPVPWLPLGMGHYPHKCSLFSPALQVTLLQEILFCLKSRTSPPIRKLVSAELNGNPSRGLRGPWGVCCAGQLFSPTSFLAVSSPTLGSGSLLFHSVLRAPFHCSRLLLLPSLVLNTSSSFGSQLRCHLLQGAFSGSPSLGYVLVLPPGSPSPLSF